MWTVLEYYKWPDATKGQTRQPIFRQSVGGFNWGPDSKCTNSLDVSGYTLIEITGIWFLPTKEYSNLAREWLAPFKINLHELMTTKNEEMAYILGFVKVLWYRTSTQSIL